MIVKEEYNRKNKFSIYLIIGLILGLFLTFINDKTIITIGVVLYAVSCLGVILYGFNQNKKLKTLVISYTGIITFLSVLSMLYRFPYATELHILMTFPILGLFYLMFRNKLTKLEYGLLLILNADLLIRNIQFCT